MPLWHSCCQPLQPVVKATCGLGFISEHAPCLLLPAGALSALAVQSLCSHCGCQVNPFAPRDLCKSDQAGALCPLWSEGEKGFGPADTFTGQEKRQLVQKNTLGKEVAAFDRQVTDRRCYLPGKCSQGSQQKEFDRQLPAEEQSRPLPAGLGGWWRFAVVVLVFFCNKHGKPEATVC